MSQDCRSLELEIPRSVIKRSFQSGWSKEVSTIKIKVKKRKLAIGKEQLENVLFFLYLCYPISNLFFLKIFSMLGAASVAVPVGLFVTYLPLFILVMHRDKNIFIPDFAILLLIICLFFAITYLLHPEYEYWYTRSDFGVISYVLRPDNGLFIYMLIRILNDPNRILRWIKISGWPIYLFYGWQTMRAISRGYWIDISNRGYEIHLSYSLSLGYNLLIFALAFLYCALEEKKIADWIGAIVGIVIIMIAGSRGPFLDIAIFLVLYVGIKIASSRKKVLLILGISVASGVLWSVFPYAISLVARVFDALHISSRFITKLLSGSITEGSGRNVIWEAAVRMIKENPFGYGAMGSRHVMSQYVYVAHPHQFFLEILIDFGVVAGTLIIVFLAVSTVRILNMKGIGQWKGVFCVFLARACQLLISLTFWHSIGMWGVIAVGVCIFRISRKGKLRYAK